MPPSTTPRARRIAVAAACVLVATCVATALVWEPEHDEGFTWWQTFDVPRVPGPAEDAVEIAALYPGLAGAGTLSSGDVIDRLLSPDSGNLNPPGYYLALNAWARLAGTHRLALTLPALAAGLAALLAIRALGRELLGSGGGLAAMALLASSPWLAGFIVFLRPYGLAVCIAIGATLAVIRADDRLARGPGGAASSPGVAFVVLSAAGLYTIYHYAFVVLWHLVLSTALAFRASRSERRRRLVWVAACGTATVLLHAPWIPVLLGHLRFTSERPWYFSGAVPLAEWPAEIMRLLRVLAMGEPGLRLIGPWNAFLALVLLFLLAWAALLGAWAARGRAGPGAGDRSRVGWLLGTALTVPVGIALADWLHDAHTLFYSNMLFGFVPAIVVAGAAIASRTGRVGRAWLVSWIVFSLTCAATNVVERRRTVLPYEAVARLLGERGDDPSTRIVLSTENPGYAVPFLLTLRDSGIERVRVQQVLAHAFDAWLDETLSSDARSPEEGTTVLIHFQVVYAPQESWSPTQVARAAERAHRAGRPFVVTPPLSVKYYFKG
jgi:hypothetical protein